MLTTILLNLPWVDLVGSVVSNQMPETAGGQLYWIAQAVSGLYLVSKGLVKFSEATPWGWDDGPARALLGWTTTAFEVVARLLPGGGDQKKPGKRR